MELTIDDRKLGEDERRRRLLLLMLSSGALLALEGCGGAGVQRYSDPRELPRGQSIFQLRGRVEINSTPATLESSVGTGDIIETFERSYAIFVVAKDAFILRANSRMQIAPSTPTLSAFSLDRGKALSVLATRETSIRTPSAIVGIRGTGVYLESEPDRSYVCTCYGTADLSPADDESISETIVSEHHSEPRYILADPAASSRIEPAPFKNHDDQELLLIETLVGRTTPYVVPRGLNRSRSNFY